MFILWLLNALMTNQSDSQPKPAKTGGTPNNWLKATDQSLDQ
jgi:hypothetical protein